jgi:membrane associated rhomboid family serine protease
MVIAGDPSTGYNPDMFPYRDENETQRSAIVTGTIIALNVLSWILAQGAGATIPLARSVCELGLIPGELTGALPVGTRLPIGDGLICATDPGRQVSHLLTSMFMHGSWMHLLGNMWFLWIFGNNVEDSRDGYASWSLPPVRAGGGRDRW